MYVCIITPALLYPLRGSFAAIECPPRKVGPLLLSRPPHLCPDLNALLSRILGPRLRVVALIDPDEPRAVNALQDKLASPAGPAWAACKVFASVDDAARALALEDVPR